MNKMISILKFRFHSQKKKLSILFFLVCVWTYSSAQVTFQKTIGGINLNSDIGRFVQQTTDGGYIFTGYGTSFGGGYLIKTDSLGDTLWTKTFGGNSNTFVQQTSDGGYIIMGGGVYLTKTDANGNVPWSKTYGETNYSYIGYSVKQTSDGGYIIIGVRDSIGMGHKDVFLIKTDSIGGLLWTKTYGGADNDEGNSVQQTTDGGFIIGGSTASFGLGSRDVYVIKTDGNGNLLWSKTHGNTGNDNGYVAQQTTDGGYIILGDICCSLASVYDICLVKTDANGDSLWTKFISVGPYCQASYLQQTSDGSYIISGGYIPNTMNFPDALLIKTDANGNWLWANTYGGTYTDEYAQMVQQTMDGGYIIMGNSNTPTGNKSYLIKTDSSGNSGCNQSGAFAQTTVGGLQVTSPATIVTSPATTITTPATIVGSGAIVTTLCTTGLQSEITNPKSEISISPNPSTGTFTISSSNNFVNAAIEIYNVLGDKIKPLSISPQRGEGTDTALKIDVSNLPSGIYFVKVSDGEKSYSEKIIIEKN